MYLGAIHIQRSYIFGNFDPLYPHRGQAWPTPSRNNVVNPGNLPSPSVKISEIYKLFHNSYAQFRFKNLSCNCSNWKFMQSLSDLTQNSFQSKWPRGHLENPFPSWSFMVILWTLLLWLRGMWMPLYNVRKVWEVGNPASVLPTHAFYDKSRVSFHGHVEET